MILQTRFELRVQYDAPAFDCRRVLRVLPLHRAGQVVRCEQWKSVPRADFALEKSDPFHNRCLMLRHARISTDLIFEMQCEVETSGAPVLEFSPDFARWKMPSRAVRFVPELQEIALHQKNLAPLERAASFARICRENLQYEARTDAHPLPSPQIWARKRGHCADFSHLFLSLCRSSGLAARYVAGFSRSQGQMHAWAEVWDAHFWHAFDPTRDFETWQRPLSHVAVAVGRDFFDCAPHVGRFRGGGDAQLQLLCHTQLQKVG